MSFWILVQILFDVVVLAGCTVIWIKLSRPTKDDPRLSRGLQLLQTKIAILEDLNDRTETQVNQLTSLMEHKVKEIQNQILLADKQIQNIEVSMSKSLEVARIFQDRIPHQEILERQNTIKYVKAARLAHQGVTVDEIAKQVDLSKGEIEFISKVNRDQLQFSEDSLPEWARQEDKGASQTVTTQTAHGLSEQPLAKAQDEMTLSVLGEKFRQATSLEPAKVIESIELAENSKGQKVEIKKVVFPKVDSGSGIL